MTGDVYHVGDTTVAYETRCSADSCAVTFTGFSRILPDGIISGDGFWDILGGNDTVGPQGELGGTPYPYVPFEWTESFPNPY